MTHSILAPSSASVWAPETGCTAAPLMMQTYPELEEKIEAKEGTAAHEICEKIILSTRDGARCKREEVVGMIATNNVVFTDEMYDSAEVYANDVLKIIALAVKETTIFSLEQKVDISVVHELCFGTPDTWLYRPLIDTIYIWDFKHGFEIVEVFENWQCLTYLSGIFASDPRLTGDTKIHIRVIQPRGFHRDGEIREWCLTGTEMFKYYNQIKLNANKSLGPDAEALSGPHCKYCSGRHACTAALNAGMSFYEMASSPLPVELSDDALGTQLAIIVRARKQLEYLETGMREQAKSRLRAGSALTGWRLAQTFSKINWKVPYDEIINLGSHMRVDLRVKKIVTPTQAKTLGLDENLVKAYSEKTKAGLTLEPDDKNRAKRIFTS